MDAIMKARSVEEVPSEREETQSPNPGGHRCREWGGGTLKRTQEKKNLGQGENQQSEVPQGPRKEKVLSLEHRKVDVPEKAENEDEGQAFQVSHGLRGRTSVERSWQRLNV